MTRELVQEAAHALTGSHTVVHADGLKFDLGGQWREVTLFGALSGAIGEVVTVETPMVKLVEYAEKHNLGGDPKWGPGKLARKIFEELAYRILSSPPSYGITLRRRAH